MDKIEKIVDSISMINEVPIRKLNLITNGYELSPTHKDYLTKEHEGYLIVFRDEGFGYYYLFGIVRKQNADINSEKINPRIDQAPMEEFL